MALTRRQRQRLGKAVAIVVPVGLAALVVASADWGHVQHAFFQPDVARKLFPKVITVAAVNTIKITALSFLGGLALGLVAAVMRLSPIRPYRWLGTLYVEFFRGTATLVLMYWFFYALPLAGLRLTPMFAAVLALGLNVGAYGAEVVRGAVRAVPRAQYEATVALNMRPALRLRRVLLPQAVALMLPPFGNLLIELMKGSAVVSLISIADLMLRAQQLRQSTGQTTAVFLVILAMYFVIAGWGHGERARSALTFFLYTFLGSLALLAGFIGLYLAADPHTFDMVELARQDPMAGRGTVGVVVLGAILLGLEILVAADLVRTVAVAPTLGNVGTLALIVLIRTFLSFSLEIEIEGVVADVHRGAVAPDKGDVAGLFVVILQHEDPVQRKPRDDLRLAAGVAGLQNAFRQQGVLVVLNRAAGHARVGRQGVGEQHFQPSILGVLQLLVIGAVLVGLVHATLQRVGADVVQRLDPRIGRRAHLGHALQRVGGVDEIDALDAAGLGAGPHLHPDKPERAEPKRLKPVAMAAGQKLVVVARKLPALPIVPLALLAVDGVALGVGHADGGAPAAGDLQAQVAGHFLAGVELGRNAAIGGGFAPFC